MDIAKCGCHGEEKNIILLGCTQAGKSSFLRFLLRYGAFEDDAKKVGVGDGNISMTQKCSALKKKIEVESSTLISKKTQAPIEPSEDHEPKELELKKRRTGKHVHLNIIDTPGLSDSGNRKARRAAQGSDSDSSGTQMAVVDEMHKISILVSLIQTRKIHAICLVIGKGAYSGSTQKHLLAILSIFQLSFPKVALGRHYHIMHTNVFPSERFLGELEERERAFAEVFKIDATHHYIDSNPILEDPQSIYFSNETVSQFLALISKQDSFEVRSLKYNKSETHKANDEILERSYNDLRLWYEKMQEAHGRKAHDTKRKKAPLLARHRLYTTQSAEIESQIDILNTDEKIKVNEGSVSVPRDIPGASRNIYVSSKSKVCEVRKGNNNGYWCNIDQRELSYGATLSVPWLENGWGWVEIYSYKRDVEAAKIRELREDRDTIESNINGIRSEDSALDEEIENENSKASAYSKSIVALMLEKLKVKNSLEGPPQFSVSRIGANLRYFTAPSVYAASIGYGLDTKISMDEIGQVLTGYQPTESTRDALEAKKAELRETVPIIDEAIRTVSLRIESFQSSAEFISRVSTHQAECAESLKHELDAPEVAENTPSMENSVKTTSEAGTLFSDLHLSQMEENATAQVLGAAEYFNACRKHELTRFEWEQKQAVQAQDGITGILSEAQQLLVKWQDQKKRAEGGIRAVDQVLLLIEGTSLVPIGAFAVLRQAVLDEVEEPCLRLWSDVTEAEMVRDLQTGLED